MRSPLSTPERSKTRWNFPLWRKLNYYACACYKHMNLRYFRLSFSFWCVSTAVATVHNNIISMCFRFHSLSKAFSNYLFPANSVKIKLKLESVRSEITPVFMHFRWKRAAYERGWKAWTRRNARVFKRDKDRISVEGGCISILIRLHGVSSQKFSKFSIYWTLDI